MGVYAHHLKDYEGWELEREKTEREHVQREAATDLVITTARTSFRVSHAVEEDSA